MFTSNYEIMFSVMRKELQETQHKYSEVSEKLLEKNRQYQKLQGIHEHESLRRYAYVVILYIVGYFHRHNVTMASFEDPHNESHHFPTTISFDNHKNKNTAPQQPGKHSGP